jgi:Protein of unknown function (DUF2975)
VEATLRTPPQDNNHFRTLDRLFWLFWMFWIGLLLVLGVVLWFVFNPSASPEGLSTDDVVCLADSALLSSLSGFGKVVYTLPFASSFVFYSACFGILHRSIRSFKAGYLFDQRMLNSLKWLGIVLVVFPFAQCLVEMGVLDFLQRFENAKLTATGSVINVETAAFGLFVLALRKVLQHGLVLKSENDLTI